MYQFLLWVTKFSLLFASLLLECHEQWFTCTFGQFWTSYWLLLLHLLLSSFLRVFYYNHQIVQYLPKLIQLALFLYLDQTWPIHISLDFPCLGSEFLPLLLKSGKTHHQAIRTQKQNVQQGCFLGTCNWQLLALLRHSSHALWRKEFCASLEQGLRDPFCSVCAKVPSKCLESSIKSWIKRTITTYRYKINLIFALLAVILVLSVSVT